MAVTDAAFYAGADVPPVIFGPSGAGLHAEDEYVKIDSLTETAKVTTKRAFPRFVEYQIEILSKRFVHPHQYRLWKSALL